MRNKAILVIYKDNVYQLKGRSSEQIVLLNQKHTKIIVLLLVLTLESLNMYRLCKL